MHCLSRMLAVSMVLLGAAGAARATDIPITGLKLVVVVKTLANSAKVVFVSKDTAITYGTGTGPEQIEANLGIAYDSTSGTFEMPAGIGWIVNNGAIAKYVNKTAPTGGSVKVGILKPALLVKVVGKSLGDTPLDISSAPSGAVYVAETVVNGAEMTQLCTQFSGCVHNVLPGGAGYKLTCKGSSIGDPACTAAVPPSTTVTTTVTSTTVTTTSTSSTTSTTICFQDLGDGTILDTCTGLQWEKKTTAYLSGENAADLHDVDNGYRWAGYCDVLLPTVKLCQPNLAAETACKAQTDAAYWANGCEQCVGAEGTCIVTPITTVWDWLSQVNAANYAGHNDWRLPSESGCNSCFASGSCASCSAHELETILVSPYPCGTSPCIESIFGPTGQGGYSSSSTSASSPTYDWSVHFNFGEVFEAHKLNPAFVRAVRGGS